MVIGVQCYMYISERSDFCVELFCFVPKQVFPAFASCNGHVTAVTSGLSLTFRENSYCCSVVTVQHFNTVQPLTLGNSSVSLSVLAAAHATPTPVTQVSQAHQRLVRQGQRAAARSEGLFCSVLEIFGDRTRHPPAPQPHPCFKVREGLRSEPVRRARASESRDTRRDSLARGPRILDLDAGGRARTPRSFPDTCSGFRIPVPRRK